MQAHCCEGRGLACVHPRHAWHGSRHHFIVSILHLLTDRLQGNFVLVPRMRFVHNNAIIPLAGQLCAAAHLGRRGGGRQQQAGAWAADNATWGADAALYRAGDLEGRLACMLAGPSLRSS